jgi:glycosyltransferase involved in cell wall biosynthesis
MAEALSCGTPVVARRRGSVPELVSDGLTGLIGETDDDLARMCKDAGQIKRALCRQEAVWRFSVEAMMLGYERAYHQVVADAGQSFVSPRLAAASLRALELEPER